MDKMLLWTFTYICCVIAVIDGAMLKAKYNMGGVTGDVTFTQTANGAPVTIDLDLNGIPNGNYKLDLHEFRVNFDKPDRCNVANIGSLIGSADATSGKGSLTASGMDLSGTKSIEGRSFVISNGDATIKVCATIEADGDYITAFAHLPANLGGTIIFRQQENSPNADTFMYIDLFYTVNTKPTTALGWQINSGSVTMDIDATTAVADRCGTTIKDMYNPDNADNTGCTMENHENCKIGDLSAKHGNITIGAVGNTKAFYGDLKLPLSGVNSIIGKTILFKNGAENFACANIIQYIKMSAAATFSNDGVRGSITFTQKSPLDTVAIAVDLQNLQYLGGGYHIHLWPVPKHIDENQAVCSSNSVSGHFNPFSVDTSTNYPGPGSTTPDKYEVGDISGKFGSLGSMETYKKNMTDPNMQLFGMHNIIGRSVVIHKNMSNSPRWVCATIFTPEDITMTTAYARFTYPVIGYMVLRQPKDMWFENTQIYVELNYANNSYDATTGHKWHIHEKSLENDTMSASGRCQSAGGHYNPYAVYLAGDYSTQCSPYNQFRCEVGDLSGKHGKLSIGAASDNKQKLFFTDMQLPLSGPQSIMGKSITIHGANSGGSRFSCADVKEKQTRTAAVTSWSSAEGQGSPTGSITFTENCDNILACFTTVNVQLSGLNSQVAGYHVHQYPTETSATQKEVCQSSDVGGHLNPFQAAFPGPPAGTLDQYEIGDLSGKYNPLSGEAYSTHRLDGNLPMDGPWSIVGRSVTIHRNDKDATRWACGNIMETTPGATLLQAKAVFEGKIEGSILLSQYRYNNGDLSNTFIVINLSYADDKSKKTTGHNWHVHEKRVENKDCSTCGGHYNPYMVDMGDSYKTECSMDNPLRCEMGDQAKKVGQYDIGGANPKRFFTDVNLNLEGTFSAAKRSVVIHGENGAAARVACADLIPYGSGKESSTLKFSKTDYKRADVEDKVAKSLNTKINNVLVLNGEKKITECITVDVYFLGVNKTKLKTRFEDLKKSQVYGNLGQFAPVCAAEFIKISMGTVLLSMLLAKLLL